MALLLCVWRLFLWLGTRFESARLARVPFYRGKRTFSIFFTDETSSLSISFRNEFNVSDVLFVDAQTKRKLSFERATALCCGETSFMMITRRWCMRAKRLRSLLLLRRRLRMLCCLLLSESCLTIFQMVRMC